MLGLCAVLMLLASIAVVLVPTTYVASTPVRIQPERVDMRMASPAEVDDSLQTLTSPAFAQRVIRKLGLDRDAELIGRDRSRGMVSMVLTTVGLRERAIAPTPRGGAIHPLLLERFASRLEVTLGDDPTVIHIAFAASSPTKAANLANGIASVFLAERGGVQPAAAASPSAGLTKLAERAQSDEQALLQYQSTLSTSASAPTEQSSDRTDEIERARSAVAGEESKFRQLNTLFRSGGAEAVIAKFPSPGLKTLQEHLAVLRRQGVELATKYGDRHPQMIALNKEQAETSKKIEEAVRRFVQAQSEKVNTARARLASLEQTPAPTSAQPDPSQDQQLRELEARAQASRAAYQDALAGGQQPTTTTERSVGGGAEQLKPASPTLATVFPNKPLMFGAAFGGSMLLSVLFALWLERPRNRFRTGRDIEAALEAPNLSVVPMATSKGSNGRGAGKSSSFSEGIRSIYAGLQLMRGGQPRVVMVTSSVPNEGKTSIAVALGRLVARGGGRVVLVDCDLRHPSVARLFSAQKMDAGLADVLVGNCDLATILRRDPLSPLEFLPAVTTSENSADLIGSQALRNLIQVLRLHYDLVILDAAPVLPIADARLLSRLADKSIYVVEWNKTPREAVQSGVSMLRSAGADVGGVVLNKADMRRHAIFSYGFNKQNGKYAGRYYAE